MALARPLILHWLLVFALLAPLTDSEAEESGGTLTPDRATYLVSKDVGQDRFTIGLNVVPGDTSRFINATGNVFRSDGGPPAFIVCQVNPDSVGSLQDPASVFSFTCRGADACPTTATACAASSWNLITNALPLEAAFFLPPGGVGTFDATATRAMASECGGVACLASRVFDGAIAIGNRLLSAVWRTTRVPSAVAQSADDKGATLSFDRVSHLVNKDVGNERWSISLNLVPVATEQGIVNQILSVTGNVFKRDGSAPSFVYCSERPDSTGSLEDPQSQYRFSCLGTDACETTAAECAEQTWRLISDDVALEASFFLPPGGLPPPPASDPEIVIIGRTSDPPSIVTKDFTPAGGTSAATGTVAGACVEGQTCFANQIGGCTGVAGQLVDIEGFGCGCRVDDLDPTCIICGSGASGACGGGCEFAVGQFMARGECLPTSSDTSDCTCFAIGAGQKQTVTGCSGPLDGGCAATDCCADDPRDGCDLGMGDVKCAGVCVPTSCPSGQGCGVCLSEQQPIACGNGMRNGSEQCDGADLPATCASLGFAGGSLRCDGNCRYDVSGCTAPTPSPTPAPTTTVPTPTAAPTAQPTPIQGPTPTPVATVTPTPTPKPTPTAMPTPTPTPVPTPPPSGDSCPYEETNGTSSGLDVLVDVGAASGNLSITYEPFGDPGGGGDTFIVETIDGSPIYSSGCVFDPDANFYPPIQDSFSFSGGPVLRLRVETFCNGGGGQDIWTVSLDCAQ